MASDRQFGREVTVTVDTIKFSGLDVAFSIHKSLKPEPNTCDLTIFNLSEDSRNQLEAIRPKGKGPATTGIPCQIDAGYEGNTETIWLGDLRSCESVIDGPNWITSLSSGDGEKAWKNARLHVSYGPKTPIDTALRGMARSLGVGEGNLSQVVSRLRINGSAIFPGGKVFSGSVSRELVAIAKSADLEVSIQDGALLFLDRGSPLLGEAFLISEQTGMLGSPSVDNDGKLHVSNLMLPGLRVGGTIVVKALRHSGAYRVEAATWSGDTSGADWQVEIEGSPL